MDLKLLTIFLLVGLAIGLSQAASAQMSGNEGGKRHQRSTQKTDAPKVNKANEKDYENALKRIPASTEKPDPWKTMR